MIKITKKFLRFLSKFSSSNINAFAEQLLYGTDIKTRQASILKI